MPAHHAIARGHLDVIKYLLGRFESISHVLDDEFSATLLHWAAGYGQVKILKFLLETHPEIGVNVRCCDNSTALMWAVQANSVECVTLLMENKADHAVSDKKGQTCLHMASAQGSLAIVEQLVDLSNVGLIGLVDNDGNSALKLSINTEVSTYLERKIGKKR